MKYLIYTLALISAFFVSAEQEYDPDSLIPAELKPSEGYVICRTVQPNASYKTTYQSGTDYSVCYSDTYVSVTGGYAGTLYSNPQVEISRDDSNYIIGTVRYTTNDPDVPDYAKQTTPINFEVHKNGTKDVYQCPPSGFPQHFIKVGDSQCAKPLVPPEPEPCSEFGNNSFLPNKSGVGQSGENACYTNPTTGQQCQFKQGNDNFIATGKSCDGDENDYGDKPTPEPTPDGGDDNCYNYGSQGQVLICDVDPNEGCNAIVVSGQQQYQCPAGCGSMDGVYFCTYDDKDGDGKPDDKNQNGVPDKDETCVNGKCTPNRPDDNTTPTPETPDMTQTNTRLDSVIGELDSIGGNIRKTNQTLDGINSGIQGMKQGQDKANGLLTGVEKNTKLTAENTDVIAGNTKGILDSISETDIGDTFNPEGSSSFYESAYENGWQGVWDEKSDLIGQTGLFVFLKQFRLTSGGSAPEMNICFDVLVNLGCKTLDPNWERLMPFLRICIFITAAFVCRRIIFGG